jgi:hypothetical protein
MRPRIAFGNILCTLERNARYQKRPEWQRIGDQPNAAMIFMMAAAAARAAPA